MQWKRRRLLWRARLGLRALRPIVDRTAQIAPGDVLAFACLRNEAARLPHFLSHYRRLGVAHFLVVDNASTDDSAALLAEAPDVSLWHTTAGYRDARFGMDWLNGLLMRHGHGHWCLTADADEALVYPDWESRPLGRLCEGFERQGIEAMGALMLDLYPRGPLTDAGAPDGPLWFDPGPYRARRRPRDLALVTQGGVRERTFFADAPARAPTLNKLPLVRWRRHYAYSNSTHAMLPPQLNLAYDGPGEARPCGVLLHTKFRPGILARSAEEKARRQHFGRPEAFDAYYDAILRRPDLWSEASVELADWRQLDALGLMSGGETGI